MNKIPKGYKLAVVNPQGEIVATLEIDGYALDLKWAQADLALGVKRAVEQAESDKAKGKG